MVADPFVDTNVLIYTLSRDDRRAHRAQQILRDGGVISVQVLNDSLLLAAAVEAGCSTFLSEDLQHGQVIEDALTVVNPFQ